jgi:ParB-like chromosome segregation protein Spo0J
MSTENTTNNTAKETTVKLPRKEVNFVQLDKIHVEEDFNQRMDYGDLEYMVKDFRNIKEQMDNGNTDAILNIPTIRGHYDRALGKYVLTDGHRRVRAAINAGLQVLPFLPTSDDEMSRLISQMTLNSGKKYNSVETGFLISKMEAVNDASETPLKKEALKTFICQKLGISASTYVNCKKIVDAPQEVRQLIIDEKISAVEVGKLMSKKVPAEKIVSITNKAIENKNQTIEKQAQTGVGQKKSQKATAKDFELGFQDKNLKAQIQELYETASERTDKASKTVLQLIDLLFQNECETSEELLEKLK